MTPDLDLLVAIMRDQRQDRHDSDEDAVVLFIAAMVATGWGVIKPRDPEAPCPACGRPASVQYGGTCQMGGCPLGGDL
jgi:hypothetical protein